MENLKPVSTDAPAVETVRARNRLVALTGQPGTGVATIAKLLCRDYDALMISMASIPRIAHEMAENRQPCDPDLAWSVPDYRPAAEGREDFHWIRPFHRRLTHILQRSGRQRIVITGILSPREVSYCRYMGARLIHFTAPEAVRRMRIGLRFPESPHPGLSLLDRLARDRPHLWSLIVDSDEPYPEFISGFKAQLGAFRR